MYLNCHTGNSFKYGTLPVKALFAEAKRCNVHKLALTEINNTSSWLDMLRMCKENRALANGKTKFDKEPYDLDLVVGVEFRNGNEFLYIALAKNNEGFEEINRFLSHHNREDKPFPQRAPRFDNAFVIYAVGVVGPEELRKNEFIGVRRHQLVAYAANPIREEFSHKFVLWHPVTFLPPFPDPANSKKLIWRDFNTHRLLRSIANNTLLSKLPEHFQALKEEFMVPERDLNEQFDSFPELAANAQALLDQCGIECELGEDKNKKCFSGSIETDVSYLREETKKGFAIRYKNQPGVWESHIEKELAIIQNKGFIAYYLIAYDLIQHAKRQGYDFVGRGSGANSTVAFCLGITNVDPIELNLYFERFLNEERVTPPDFDIDFSWDNRDAIYEYIFDRYGYDHVCLLGTHTTYQEKSVLRELGKVFGLPKEEIDTLVDTRKMNVKRDHIAELIFSYARYIVSLELPANISIHAGGVLITEKPIYTYTATEFPPKSLPVSQFEMHAAEDFGIYKFDILSQRGLGHIKETVKHVKRNRGIDVDVYQFRKFTQDEKIKNLLRHSKAMGCFYVESPAMRMLLEKLKCDDYLTLVAASSIIRPGVASSGMMQEYIKRFHMTKAGVRYESIHPVMDELMADTFGVMVYQEDVIKVAHHFGKLTLTQSDVLRRGMSGKYRSREEFQRVKDQFFENCKKLYPQPITDRVWYEIESFAGYSFAKGHSASYAVESYQSLFLKAHYPLEFMVGVINNFGGFYRTEFYVHEARMNGAIIEPPCVNNSEYLTTIDDDRIYIGFVHLKSLETKVARQISAERGLNGPYKSLDNFLRRIDLGLEQLRILIRIGAFRFIAKTKQQLLWEAMLWFSDAKNKTKTTVDLFDTDPKEYPLPVLQRNEIEDAFDEIELLGFPLCNPFRLIENPERGILSDELKLHVGEEIRILGYCVTTKPTFTRTGVPMAFGTFNDREGKVFDTVHFPDIEKKYPLRGRGFYEIKGRVTEEYGVFSVEVTWMDKVPMLFKKTFPPDAFRENQHLA
ncbi:MAG: DNA polymerase III subunit alpha [Cyclobacteriaceae bacterium]